MSSRWRCSIVQATLLLAVHGWSARARAETRTRWSDDELVLAARRQRLSVGAAVVYQAEGSYQAIGSGLNLEQTVGLGRNFEFGARFGVRMDRGGQGMRADEFARGLSLDTFGTGLSVTANPELRLGFRAARFPSVPLIELGFETRLVLPTVPDPNTTGVLGVSTRVHALPILRLDASGFVALTSQKFYEEREATVVVSLPVSLWLAPGRVVYFGLLQDLRHDFSTRYTSELTRWSLGAGIGVRVGAFDVLLAAFIPDTLGEGIHRTAAGVTLSGHL